jgi:hypothetical protein
MQFPQLPRLGVRPRRGVRFPHDPGPLPTPELPPVIPGWSLRMPRPCNGYPYSSLPPVSPLPERSMPPVAVDKVVSIEAYRARREGRA